MAPISPNTDFLDDALKNKTILPSWRSIFTRITAPLPPIPPSPATLNRISTFIHSPSSQQALLNCHNPFLAPSQASKQDFEKRTAPINFTAADQSTDDALNALPPIGELKTAALQLSTDLGIDEVSALRVVVLEHQARPSKALLAAKGGDGEYGVGGFGMSLRSSLLNNEDEKEKEQKIFFNRVEVYLMERKYVIKVAAALTRAALSVKKENVWGDIGRRFVEEVVIGQGGMLEKLVDGISRRWDQNARSRDLPRWVEERLNGEYGEQVAHAWDRQNMLETIHMLQLLFLQLYRPVEEVSGMLVMNWFNLMKSSRFLSVRKFILPTIGPEIENLHNYVMGLTSVVSLAMLQIPRVEQCLRDEFSKPSSTESSATPPAIGPTGPPRLQPTISDKTFYIKNPSSIKVITNCLKEVGQVVTAGLVGMGWVVILDALQYLVQVSTVWGDGEEAPHRRGGMTVELYSSTLPQLFPTTVEVGIKNLAQMCAKSMLVTTTLLLEPSELTAETSSGRGFCLSCEEDGLRMKNVLAHLLRKVHSFMDFSGPLIAAAFLTNDIEYEELPDFWKFLDEDQPSESSSMLSDADEVISDKVWSGSPAQKFWTDDDAIALLERAKNRFPYEPLPFLQMIRGLATENQTALDYLTRMTSYTQQLPSGFRDYDVVDEDADVMTIRLVTDLVLFAPRQGGIFDEDAGPIGFYTSDGGIIIPRGTMGVVTSSGSSRPVVAWQFEYNALPLFGRILECALHPEPMNSHITSSGGLGSEDGIIEIARILTLLVASSKEAAASLARTPGQFDLPQVLEDASDMLGRNRDVISIMFDLLEVALNRGNTTNPMYIIGVQFVESLVHIVPGRVWPYLARSALLEHQGRGGALSKILSAVEVVRGDYTFTLTSLRLFETLVDEAVRSSAIHIGQSKALIPTSKQAPAAGTGGTGVSPVVQRNILIGFTQTAVDIFESFRGYKYADIAQKLELGTRLTRIFTTILDYVYGADDGSDQKTKITSVLVPSAEHLVAVFLSTEASDLSHGPILGAMEDGVHTPESSLYLKSLSAWIEQIVQVIKFSDILVRARVYLGYPGSQFEKRLYASAASMAKLYGANERYKQHVLELFESLVKASGSFAEEPPSLLGYLGSQCANHFVTLLATVDKPYQDPAIEIRIWNFVTAVVSNKQQGMSILLLRGETLRQGNGTGSVANPTKRKSMLSICLEALEDIDRLPVEKTLAMLEAVSTAQNFWSLAMDDLGKHSKFLPAITKHVETYTIELLPADSKEIITQKAYKIAIAGHIARILALYMHSRRPSERDESFFKLLLPRLNFYFEKAVKIQGYRPSLHGLLQKNFEEKWAGIKLSQFKKTRLRRKDYGMDAVYDVELASKVLGFDPGWDGRSDGYRSEVEESNANLSIVQTQVDLLHAWELLAMELCDFATNSPDLTRSLLTVIETCLSENITTGLPLPVFTQIITRRCEFAFVLTRRLYSVLSSTLDLTGVFIAAWKSITNSTTDFRTALQNAEMDYFRSLLRILYISLTSAASRSTFKPTSEFSFTVLDLLDLVVCKGFKDLSQSAHNHPQKSNPQDIALLTAILQSALRIPNITDIHPALSTHLATNDTIRAATTLFSWSADLKSPDLAELAALFLVELSTVPIISHQLATENTLDALLASEISALLPNTPELRRIWTRGLLPLALNLLASIGANVGREVIAFLGHFKALLSSGVEFWLKTSVVMRENVDEAVKIAMVWAVVRRLGGGRELSGLGVDVGVMEEGVAYLLSHRNYLKSLVVEGEEAVAEVEKGLGMVGELLVDEETGGMEE